MLQCLEDKMRTTDVTLNSEMWKCLFFVSFFERAKYAQMINLYSSLSLFKWYIVYLSVFKSARPDEIYPVVLTEVRKG